MDTRHKPIRGNQRRIQPGTDRLSNPIMVQGTRVHVQTANGLSSARELSRGGRVQGGLTTR